MPCIVLRCTTYCTSERGGGGERGTGGPVGVDRCGCREAAPPNGA